MTKDSSPQRAALEDALIVVRCQLGERAAFDQLIKRWQTPLWRYARNLTGSKHAADDVAQEVWLRVLRGIARLRDGAGLRAWLFGIARNILMDRLRQQYAWPVSDEADFDSLAAADEGWAEHEIELAALQTALAALPLRENEVLTLFYLQELTLEQIAALLGIPSGTVKSRLFRARKMLRQQLDQQGVLS
ncbi:MAG: sigma-70 family RNA polymerase sigma factor [Massilia sp.]